MSLKMNTGGLDKLAKKLKELGEQKSVSFGELMPPSFISAFSNVKDIQELFDASPFKIEDMEDLGAIPDADWDIYIAQSTNYASWEEMRHAAVAEWTRRKLDLG